MATIRSSDLSRRLRAADTQSQLAGVLDRLPGPSRLNATQLDRALDAFERGGGVLSAPERKRLDVISLRLTAPGFYGNEAGAALERTTQREVKLTVKKLNVEPWKIELPDYASGKPVLSPDRGTLYSANCDGNLKAFNPNNGELKFQIKICQHSDSWWTPLLSADGKSMFLGGKRDLVKIDLETREVVWRADPIGGRELGHFSLDPQGNLVVNAGLSGGTGSLALIDAQTGKPRWTTSLPDGCIGSGAPASDGKQVYVTTWHQGAGRHLAYDAANGEEAWALGPPAGYGGRGQLLAPERQTLFATSDGVLSAIDTATGQQRWSVTKDDRMDQGPMKAFLTEDGRLLQVVGDELRIFDADTGAEQPAIKLPKVSYDSIDAPVLSKDGQSLIFHDGGGRFFRLDLDRDDAEREAGLALQQLPRRSRQRLRLSNPG
jgi:outer membrane protein assembly factor BamB